MSKSLLIILTVLVVATIAPNAHADDFSFSFTNTDGNLSGTVTGEILGLTDNTTGPAAQVLIESYPSAIASIVGPGPIDATLFYNQLANSFTETNGVVTAGEFAAYNPQPGILDELSINFDGETTMQVCGYPCYQSGYEYVDNYPSGLSADNIQPLDPVSTPEPSTFELAFTGLMGLIALRRKVFTRNV
jgi:hypothetical protein